MGSSLASADACTGRVWILLGPPSLGSIPPKVHIEMSLVSIIMSPLPTVVGGSSICGNSVIPETLI